jgi:16S rRNA (cytidine1402-2'-O)-methyltransferase
VLAPGSEQARGAPDADKVLRILLDALAPSDAARLAAKITGAPRNELYRKALKS